MTAEVKRAQPRYKSYASYKDSGVEWLGAIPASWGVDRLKFIADTRFSSVDKHTIDGEVPVRLCNYTDVYYREAITAEIEFMKATATRDEVECYSVRADDVLITKDSETWEDIAVAAHVPETLENVLCGYHLALVRPKRERISGSYLTRAFSARGINDQFRVAATGITRFGIGQTDINDVTFCLPSISEQRAIAEFLDRETAKIDELIAKKERLIQLLEEKRAALITHAVTRGLNPDAPARLRHRMARPNPKALGSADAKARR
jgi:type I restriction enzyme, S subunit